METIFISPDLPDEKSWGNIIALRPEYHEGFIKYVQNISIK